MELTKVQKQALDIIKVIDPDVWFSAYDVLPHTFRRPNYICGQLYTKGCLNRRLNAERGDWEYSVGPK